MGLQLPIFPEGMTELSTSLAVQRQDGWVYCADGMAPVFQHESKDVAAFRLFTSQLVAQGTVKEADITRVFGVPCVSVARAVKLCREVGPKGFFKARRVRSGGVLKGETHLKAQALLDAGKSVPEVSHCWTRGSIRWAPKSASSNRVKFRVAAFDEKEKISEGTHERHIVNAARFAPRGFGPGR